MKLVSRIAGLLVVALTLSACGGSSGNTAANAVANSPTTSAQAPTTLTSTRRPPVAPPATDTAVAPSPTTVLVATATLIALTATPASTDEGASAESPAAMGTREAGEKQGGGGKLTKGDVIREDGYLDSAVKAIQKNDFALAKKSYAEYEACWAEFGDQVKDYSASLYQEIEGKMDKVSHALNGTSPAAASSIATLTSLKQSTDKENALLTKP